MLRSVSKRKRKGKYNCKLYERARRAELKLKMITDAHDSCINERETRIERLMNAMKHTHKVLVAAVVAAGGEVTIDFEKADKYSDRDLSVTQLADETFAFKYIGSDK